MRPYVYGFLHALLVFIAGSIAFFGVGLVAIYFGYRARYSTVANLAIDIIPMCLMAYAMVPLSLKLFRNLAPWLIPQFVYSATLFFLGLQVMNFVGPDGIDIGVYGFVSVVLAVVVFHLTTVKWIQSK